MKEKEVVSPFEYAIANAANPKHSENMRPETLEEKSSRITAKFKSIADKMIVKTSKQ